MLLNLGSDWLFQICGYELYGVEGRLSISRGRVDFL